MVRQIFASFLMGGLIVGMMSTQAIASRMEPVNQIFTLEQAVTTALQKSPTLQAAELGIAAQAAVAKAAQAALFYPYIQIELSGDYSNSNYYYRDFGTSIQDDGSSIYYGDYFASQSTSQYLSFGPSVRVAYPIYTGGRQSAELRRSNAELRSDTFRRDMVRRNLTYQVIQAFYSVIALRTALDDEIASFQSLKEIKESAETQYAAGTMSLYDLNQLRIELNNQELAMEDAENGLFQGISGLFYLLGASEKVTPSFNVKSFLLPGDLSLSPQMPDLSFDTAWDQALKRRPELQQAMAAIDVADAIIAKNVSEFIPQLDFVASVSYERTPNLGGTFSLSHPSANEDYLNFYVGLTLTWNFTSVLPGSPEQWNLNESQQRHRIAQLNLQAARDEIRTELLQKIREYRLANLELQRKMENLRMSEDNLRSAKEKLVIGLITVESYVNVEDGTRRARYSARQSKLNLKLKTFGLLQAMGEDLRDYYYL